MGHVSKSKLHLKIIFKIIFKTIFFFGIGLQSRKEDGHLGSSEERFRCSDVIHF